MLLNFDVIVETDTAFLPVGIGKRFLRQRLQGRTIYVLEQLPSAGTQVLCDAGVEDIQTFTDGRIQLPQ